MRWLEYADGRMVTRRMKSQANAVDEGERNGLDAKLEDDSRDARMGFKLPFAV